MYRKRLIILVIIALILTGCTKVTNNLDDIVDATISKELSSVNTVSTGYELYIPIGVTQLIDSEYNQKLKIKDTYVYLYVDTISYYYKNSLNYKQSNNYDYYYKEINLNGKTGYIGVKKTKNDEFFCEIVYNYSKIEFYSNLEKLPIIMANSLMMVNSIKFNDELIKIELDSITSDGREITYELDKPIDSESTFDKKLKEYVEDSTEETVLPDDE